jgi:hypothetical protein
MFSMFGSCIDLALALALKLRVRPPAAPTLVQRRTLAARGPANYRDLAVARILHLGLGALRGTQHTRSAAGSEHGIWGSSIDECGSCRTRTGEIGISAT